MTHALLNIARPLVRWCFRLAVVIAIPVFIVGIIQYPDGPISAHDGGFYGKQGQPHSESDYATYTLWERTSHTAWPVMIALAGLRYWSDPTWRKRRYEFKDF